MANPEHDQQDYPVRRVRGPVRAQLLDFALLAPPFALLVYWGFHTRSTPTIASLVAGAVVIWAIGFYRQWRRMHRLRCPECGTMLKRRPPEQLPDPIRFVCTRCEVIWETGLTEDTDSA